MEAVVNTKFLTYLFVVLLLCAPQPANAGKFFDEHLPNWVDLDIQYRYRYENFSDADFNDTVDDNKGFSLGRTRINLGLTPIEDLKLFYQFQDSRIWNDTKTAKQNFEDWGETRQLWAQYDSTKAAVEEINLSKAGFRFGRQELSYGAQRLVGGFNWSNIAQTFDAGKIMLSFDPIKLNVDLFAGGKTPNKSPRERDDFYDGSSNDRLAGYYLTYKGIEHSTVEQYLLTRNTDGKNVSFGQTGDGEIEDYTIGGRVKGKIPDSQFDYEVEAAYQFGNSGELDVSAQMAVAILGYTFEHDWKPRLSFEFDYASGDGDSSDGDRNTFDNLYPTNHLHYGYIDFASLQNLNDYRIQLKAKPADKLVAQLDYHIIYLDTASDNLYSAGRTIKRATAPDAGRHVGNELDLKTKYTFNEYANVLLGYSHFATGDFLSDTGNSNNADFFYAQTVLNF